MNGWPARAIGILASLGGLGACTAPCDRLAGGTCEREGRESRACEEIRAAARRATDDDQERCREVLRILEGPGEGTH